MMPTRPEEAARLSVAARALGVPMSEVQRDALLAYLDLLERWNRSINLTGVREREGLLTQHLFDCLAVLAPLRREAPSGGRLLDVGSGGGLPGVVIAVLAPEFEVTCVDAVHKKAAFVRQVAGELGLARLATVHGRIETLDLEPFNVVASRAFASLAEFTRLTASHLANRGCWMAMKGRQPADEIAALPPGVEVFHVEPLRVPDLPAARCIVWMRPKLR